MRKQVLNHDLLEDIKQINKQIPCCHASVQEHIIKDMSCDQLLTRHVAL